MSTSQNVRGSSSVSLQKILPAAENALAIIYPATATNSSHYNKAIKINSIDIEDIKNEILQYVNEDSLLYRTAVKYRQLQGAGDLYITPIQDNGSGTAWSLEMSYGSNTPTAGVSAEYEFSICGIKYAIEVLSTDTPSLVFGKIITAINDNSASLVTAGTIADGAFPITANSKSLEYNGSAFNFASLFANFPTFSIDIEETQATLEAQIDVALASYEDKLVDIFSVSSRWDDIEDHLQAKSDDNPEHGKLFGFGLVSKALIASDIVTTIPYGDHRLTQIDATIIMDAGIDLARIYNHDLINIPSEIAIAKYAAVKNVRSVGATINRYDNTILTVLGGPGAYTETTEDLIVNGLETGLYAEATTGKVYDIRNSDLIALEYLGYTYTKMSDIGSFLTSQTFMCANIFVDNPGRNIQQRLQGQYLRNVYKDITGKFCKERGINANADTTLRQKVVVLYQTALDNINATYPTYFKDDNLKAYQEVLATDMTVVRTGNILKVRAPIKVGQFFESFETALEIQTYQQ